MLAGVAETDITPRRSLDLAGVPCGKSQGVLDSLKAQALILQSQNGAKICIISIDTLYIAQKWGEQLRNRIGAVIGTAAEQIMLCASHTHSGPALMSIRRWGEPDKEYMDELADKIVRAAKHSDMRLAPSIIKIGTSSIDNISVNRRQMNGPVDPVVTIIEVDNSDSTPMARIFNFACHPICLWGFKNLYSPDFPGYIRQKLQLALDKNTINMFINGAAGNINPINFNPWQTSSDYADYISEQIAQVVLKACNAARIAETEPISAKRKFCNLQLDLPPSLEKIDAQSERMKLYIREHPEEAARDPGLYRVIDWAADMKQAIERHSLPKSEILEIQMFRIGTICLVAIPAELYVEIGLKLIALSPFCSTIIAGYSNGMVGYINTRQRQREIGSQEKFIGIRLLSLSANTEDVIYQISEKIFGELYDA